jgi:hypothetical protein
VLSVFFTVLIFTARHGVLASRIGCSYSGSLGRSSCTGRVHLPDSVVRSLVFNDLKQKGQNRLIVSRK